MSESTSIYLFLAAVIVYWWYQNEARYYETPRYSPREKEPGERSILWWLLIIPALALAENLLRHAYAALPNVPDWVWALLSNQ